MSDLNKLTDKPEEKSQVSNMSYVNRNKKMLLWAILVVVVLVVVYVLFGDNVKQFRLCTETRADLKDISKNVPSMNAGPVLPLASATETSIGVPSSVVSEASAVRKELVNLFRTYA
jgi:cytoskeletal protein RodZ